MEALTVVRVGATPVDLLAPIAAFLSQATRRRCDVHPAVINPDPAWDSRRHQVSTRALLPLLEDIAQASSSLVLGIADDDLFSPVFTFVFGEAILGGRAGVVSLYRLRPTVYGLADDPALVEARLHREALHETGHLLGLIHCQEASCVMRFSGSAEEIELKDNAFCERCAEQISTGEARTSPAVESGQSPSTSNQPSSRAAASSSA